MIRHHSARVASSLIVAAVLLIGACQSAPPAPTLTNPAEILAAAVTSTTAAKSVRVDATADGRLIVDLLGLGTPAPIELAGTTASADVDLEGGDARVTFSAPGLLGVTGELRSVDGTQYLQTSLTGALWQSLGTAVPTPDGDDRASILSGLTDLLATPGLDPVKGEDTACGNTTCYRVDIKLEPADLVALGAGDLETPAGLPFPLPIPDLSTATIDLTVLVATDTTRLTGFTAVAELGQAGTATAQLTFSKWDEGVSVSAPPPAEVAPAG